LTNPLTSPTARCATPRVGRASKATPRLPPPPSTRSPALTGRRVTDRRSSPNERTPLRAGPQGARACARNQPTERRHATGRSARSGPRPGEPCLRCAALVPANVPGQADPAQPAHSLHNGRPSPAPVRAGRFPAANGGAAAALPDSYRLGRSSDWILCTRAASNKARGDRNLSPVSVAAGSAADGCRWGRERQRRGRRRAGQWAPEGSPSRRRAATRRFCLGRRPE
jgi:hypothetical protein